MSALLLIIQSVSPTSIMSELLTSLANIAQAVSTVAQSSSKPPKRKIINIPGDQPEGKSKRLDTDVKVEQTTVEGTRNKPRIPAKGTTSADDRHVEPTTVKTNHGKTCENPGRAVRTSLASITTYELYLQFMETASKLDRKRCALRFVEFAKKFLSHKLSTKTLLIGTETTSDGCSAPANNSNTVYPNYPNPDSPVHRHRYQNPSSTHDAPRAKLAPGDHSKISSVYEQRAGYRNHVKGVAPLPPDVYGERETDLVKTSNKLKRTAEINTAGLETRGVTMFCRLPESPQYLACLSFFSILCRWKWTSSEPAKIIVFSLLTVVEYFIETTAIFFAFYLLFYGVTHLSCIYYPKSNQLPFSVSDVFTERFTSGIELNGTSQEFIPLTHLKGISFFADLFGRLYPGFKPANLCFLNALGFTHYHQVTIYISVYESLKETKSGISSSLPSVSSLYNKVAREHKDHDADVLLSTCCYFVQRNEIAMKRATYYLGVSAKSTPLFAGRA